MLEMNGKSFTGVSVTVNERTTVLFEVPPSFTVTLIVAVPLAFATGRKARLPDVPGLVDVTARLVTRFKFVLVAVIVRIWGSFAAPEEIPVRGTDCRPESSTS